MTDTQTTASAPRKRQAIANASFEGSSAFLKFHFPEDTKTVLHTDFAKLSPNMQTKVGVLGIVTALQRSYTGIATSIPEAIELANRTRESLYDDTWEPTQKGERASGPSDLVLAVERVEQKLTRDPKNAAYGSPTHPRAEIIAAIEALTPAEKRSMRTDPDIARALADIQIERAREMAKAAKAKPGSTLLSGLFAPAKQAAQAAQAAE